MPTRRSMWPVRQLPMRTLAVVHPLVMHVVTAEGRGIAKMSELKGKRVLLVSTDPASNLGEMLGVKGLIVNLVVRKVKKMVPAYDLPGAISFKQALAEGAAGKLSTPPIGHDDLAFLQYTSGSTAKPRGARSSTWMKARFSVSVAR